MSFMPEPGRTTGLTQDRGTLELEQVMQADGDDWRLIYAPDQDLAALPVAVPAAPPFPERLTLRLITPLRLNHEERLVSQDRFRFHLLFSSLLRRISLLMAFHTDQTLETDFIGLTQAAQAIALDRVRLRWRDWARFSSRQDALIKMGGLVGEIELDGGRTGTVLAVSVAGAMDPCRQRRGDGAGLLPD
jgi:hypothetical protein